MGSSLTITKVRKRSRGLIEVNLVRPHPVAGYVCHGNCEIAYLGLSNAYALKKGIEVCYSNFGGQGLSPVVPPSCEGWGLSSVDVIVGVRLGAICGGG